MKIYVITLRNETSKKRCARLMNSLIKFGWKASDIVPVYSRNAECYKALAEEYNVKTHWFYDSHPENKTEYDRAFSCTIGHVEAWKKIAFGHSGGGIIVEDDVVFYSDPRFVPQTASNNKINWLGLRIWNESDYSIPYYYYNWIPVDRFEGTHAYYVSEGMARRLYYQFQKHGFDDSIDGQLGMRNIFNCEYQLLDPPIAMAVVGDQVSTITGAEPAFWNAQNPYGFLSGLKAGSKVPTERKLVSFDQNWSSEKASVIAELDWNESSCLFIGASDGIVEKDIADAIGGKVNIVDSFNEDSYLCVRHNTYLSKNYYNIGLVDQKDIYETLVSTVLSHEPFQNIVINAKSVRDVIINIGLSNLLLNSGGLLIIRGIDSTFESVIERTRYTCLLKLPTCQIWQKN